jgi:O-antigen/teichoic acid export membrane protein
MSITKVSLTQFFRILGLLGRAGTIFTLASVIGPDDMAVFGLVSSYAALFVILNGLDVTRSIQNELKSNSAESSSASVTGTLFNFLLVVSLLFCAISLYFHALFPFQVSILQLFILLVIFEHFAQEAGRILIVMNFHFENSIGILVRSFLPMLVFCLLFILKLKVSVFDALTILIVFSLISAVYSWVALSKKVGFKLVFEGPQILLILFNVRKSLFFFAATLMGKALLAIDKTFIEDQFGSDYLASYILVLGVSMVAVPLTEIFIGSYALPRFYEVGKSKGLTIQREFNYYFLKAIVFSSIYISISVIVVNEFLFIVFSNYKELNLLEIILISFTSYLLSLNIIPTYYLAAQKKSFFTFLSSVPSILIMLFFIFFVDFSFLYFLILFLFCFALIFFIRLYFVVFHIK